MRSLDSHEGSLSFRGGVRGLQRAVAGRRSGRIDMQGYGEVVVIVSEGCCVAGVAVQAVAGRRPHVPALDASQLR